MRTKILSILAVIAVAMSSCTKLNSGDSFNQVINGIEYKFEVIVSKMTYVRLTPVSAPSEVRGEVTVPTAAEHDGVSYKVTQIGERAFKDYTGITKVTLPKMLSKIEAEAFAGCVSLREINTPQPLSVIGDYAFDGCISLSAFSLDASISELGKGVFRGCESIETLEFTPTFTKVPDELCCGCIRLRDIVLPPTIMEVGESAFEDCLSAGSITIDRSLQRIGAYAFSGCHAVETIVCMTPAPPSCQPGTFDGIAAEIPVIVPMANVDDYRNAAGWSRFSNIIGKY